MRLHEIAEMDWIHFFTKQFVATRIDRLAKQVHGMTPLDIEVVWKTLVDDYATIANTRLATKGIAMTVRGVVELGTAYNGAAFAPTRKGVNGISTHGTITVYMKGLTARGVGDSIVYLKTYFTDVLSHELGHAVQFTKFTLSDISGHFAKYQDDIDINDIRQKAIMSAIS